MNRQPSEGPYEALLVDYGGVLTTSVTTSFAAFCVANGINPERLKALLAPAYSTPEGEGRPTGGVDLIGAIETGALESEEFERRLAEALSEGLPEPLDHTNLSTRMLGQVGPDERMIEAVRSARRQGIKTGLISNTWGLEASPSASLKLEIFDVRVLSGEEGVRKPEPEIYLRAAARLRVPPEQCVFVDDLPSNVEGARAVGMAGILHRDPAITVPKLEALFALTLS